MKITLAQWLTLDKLRKEAVASLNALETAFQMIALEHDKAKNEEEVRHLMRQTEKIEEALTELGTINTDCQSEWMGGPTSGPHSKNTKTYIREPQFTGKRHRHFTTKEVAEAKKLGLLKGGPDLTGPKD